MKAIKDELGENDENPEDELEELQKKIDAANLPDEVEKSVQRGEKVDSNKKKTKSASVPN